MSWFFFGGGDDEHSLFTFFFFFFSKSELVELLGNAKSSTASREDIERSGLEVIKRSQLEEYEKSKKISSNCAERVCFFFEFLSLPSLRVRYGEEEEERKIVC